MSHFRCEGRSEVQSWLRTPDRPCTARDILFSDSLRRACHRSAQRFGVMHVRVFRLPSARFLQQQLVLKGLVSCPVSLVLCLLAAARVCLPLGYSSRPRSTSDSVRLSDQSLRDYIGPLHWFPVVTNRIVGVSQKVDRGL